VQIAESSGRLLEFTREYGVHAHQRAGQNPQSIPHIQTVDALMQKSQKIQDSLYRIRDVVLAQTAAIEASKLEGPHNMPPYAANQSDYPDENLKRGGSSDFTNPDTKKRRGVSLLSKAYL
jgi:hypothetical protein